MFDIWWGDIELTTLAVLIAIFVVLPGQTLLCFRVRSLTVRLIPAICFAVLAGGCLLLGMNAQDWSSLGYFLLAILFLMLLLACGTGWGIWAVVSCIRKRSGHN